jgi:serine/threonine protein kinase
VGDYIRKRRLGQGCFGEVWLARHEGFAADFAVKFVPEANIVSPTAFYREPRLLKLLEHPNIVKVHDTGRLPNGDLFIAMEYLKRGSLAAELRGDTLNLRALKQIFCGAMRGLQFAHDRDFIHRDIKPANILIADDMSGKLGDFGLATKLGPGGIASPQFYYTYVAPEVLISGATTKTSDVYAMAVTMYEALNGKSYLPAANSLDDLKQMISAGSFPDRAYYRVYVPKKLRLVINKAMSVIPSERFKSAEEFRHALEQIPIRASCQEQMSQTSFDWDSQGDEERLRVSMLPQSDGKWRIETLRQTVQGATLRRVTRLCLRNLTEIQARKAVHRITSGFISGGSASNIRAS